MARDYQLQPFHTDLSLSIDYARELNPQQLAVVTAAPGPALVLAGAGAGKTRTLIYRVAFLLDQGVAPEHLLLLTFTNKAAQEMMRRVAELIPLDLGRLWGGTFHAVGNRVLRRHAERLGYRPDFTILDREDARDLVSACLGEAGIDVKATRFPKPEVLAEMFSLAVNRQLELARLLAQSWRAFESLAPQILDLQQRYAERKRRQGLVDFDDLLVLWLRLLREAPEVREHYQRRFQFVLVDEYQDTNQIQSDLVDLLAEPHQNIMAVGDDSQSIYSWRGANFQNILRFPQRHPTARVFKIETNYRSTPEILALANAAITPNVHQHPKELVAVRASGVKPGLVVCGDAQVQATFVAQRALELREEGVGLERMAVLYRSHFHALELQLELTRRNIPFSITSGIRFFEQAHVKDVAAYLKLACNPGDELAFKRLVKMLPGVGPKAADRLWKEFFTRAPQPRAAPAGVPSAAEVRVATALQALQPLVPKKSAVPWAQLVATMAQLEAEPMRQQPAEMIRLTVEAVYEEYLMSAYTETRARSEDLEQLALFARQFSSVEEFLTQLALLTSVEAESEARANRDEERLRLTTIHQAKGLEFDVVFVVMLCDGLFPSARAVESPESEEEERRLFYVAITRARNELYLCYPQVRTMHSGGHDYFQQPSRFLHELPRELMEEWNLRLPGTPGSEAFPEGVSPGS